MIVEMIAGLFFLLFTYTAMAKILTFKTFVFDLGRDPLLENFATFLGVAIPLVELVIAALLIMPKYKKAGLISSMILMALFTVYVGLILAFKNEERHCTCGGFIREMSWRQHLWFNIGLTLIALWGVKIQKRIIKATYQNAKPVFTN